MDRLLTAEDVAERLGTRTHLLKVRKVPKNERARLQQIRREYQTVIDSMEGTANWAA